MAPCVSTALMIGGGIAGLSAAVALSRAGVRCDVVELSDVPLGAALALSGRAAEALDELGLYDACLASGTPFDRNVSRTSVMDAEGRLVSPGPQRPDWPGSKTAVGIYRPTLVQILTAAAERHGVTIRTGVTAERIQDLGASSLVTLSDGEQRRYELIVGADGIGSRTRTELFPNAPAPAYAGQLSFRWLAPGPPVEGEGWYVGPVGRVGFYRLPQELVYVPAVVDAPTRRRLTDQEAFKLFSTLLDSYSAPAIVELRGRLTADAELVCRPFESLLMPDPWHQGRTILIGDAAHATTAHMGMGGGMAMEDAVVLAQSVASEPDLPAAFGAFMSRRFARVRTVVETSLALSHLERQKAPAAESAALMNSAFQTLSAPY